MINHLFIFLFLCFTLSIQEPDLAKPIFVKNERYKQELTISQKAYKILENKCNSCHLEEYKRKVFTEENMNRSAKSIYKQVFLKKKMPKGDDVKLSVAEHEILEEWLVSIGVENS
ncbi:MAG: hypothetical protein AAFY41_00890 [Bacteroidota bacterium]